MDPSLSHHVYILKCADGHLYVGCTSDLAARMQRHAQGLVHYTRNKLPVSTMAVFSFADRYTAFNFEKYLKTGSGRAFMKRHLIPA